MRDRLASRRAGGTSLGPSLGFGFWCYLSVPTNGNAAATQSRNAAGAAISGFGWINTSITNIQTGGAIPTTRNGQLVARFRW